MSTGNGLSLTALGAQMNVLDAQRRDHVTKGVEGQTAVDESPENHVPAGAAHALEISDSF